MQNSERKIIHVDCDCFYASVEIRENPDLRGHPVAVGGMPDRRGVIATCNYEARAFGIHSAMASAYACKLCPDLIIIKPHFDLYKTVSRDIHRVFADYTDIIEPLSLDEAYLDVSNCQKCHGSATLIAREIRVKVKEASQITVSAGVAPNKFLAKIASDWNKPDGLCIVTPDQIDQFVRPLPVRKLHGVGKATAARLQRMGVKTCEDLRRFSLADMNQHFGSFGGRLYEMARGLDPRPVETNRRRKSISVENTYDNDLPDIGAVSQQLPALLNELQAHYEKISKEYAVSKRFVKIKFSDFTQTTLEKSCILNGSSLYAPDYFMGLAVRAWKRAEKPVRLLGVGFRLHDLKPPKYQTQLELFEKQYYSC
ncbi:MAG: DNA polymerase IV [Endozoicomonadaceae bacterium]|nr:DNA polymerase IV [Endozoicomonadaceae bacterium]